MDIDKLRNILNSIFLIGALASLIVYFAVDDKKVFFYVCGITLLCKLIEFVIRFIHR